MIGGNTWLELQVRNVYQNEIGEVCDTWETVRELKGWLDLQSGTAEYEKANAKLEESMYIFVCDYEPLNELITVENSRMIGNNKIFDILHIDNPMELNRQLEFSLKHTGGVSSVSPI